MDEGIKTDYSMNGCVDKTVDGFQFFSKTVAAINI